MKIIVRKDHRKAFEALSKAERSCSVCGNVMGPGTHVRLDGLVMHKCCWNREYGKLVWTFKGRGIDIPGGKV